MAQPGGCRTLIVVTVVAVACWFLIGRPVSR